MLAIRQPGGLGSTKRQHRSSSSTRRGDAVAIQERKRRTATTFVVWRDSDDSREVILQVWRRVKADPTN